VLLSSWVSEAGDGLVWCDLDGRRVAGTRGIGAGDGWGGAELLARDVGTKPVANHEAYLAGSWFVDKAEVWALGANQKLFTYQYPRKEDWGVG
jgi:hypothetical protein